MAPLDSAQAPVDCRNNERVGDGDGGGAKRVAQCSMEEAPEVSLTPTEA